VTTTPRTPPPNGEASAPLGAGATTSSAASAAGTTAAGRVIKRYSNRKLYDTVESRYVTLPQIAQLVRKGEDVRIIDNNTKEDLTSVTLAQILYEEERKQSRALPLTALKDLIHTSGEKIMSSLRESPVGKFIGPKGDQPGEGGVAAAPAPTSVPVESASRPEAMAPGAMGKDGATSARLYEMLEQSRVSVQEWQHRVDERVRKVLEGLTPATQIEKLQAEVRRLSQRVEELEAKLGEKRKD
jgi:polyhydroxyalkanoate synthesis repressor PhaR